VIDDVSDYFVTDEGGIIFFVPFFDIHRFTIYPAEYDFGVVLHVPLNEEDGSRLIVLDLQQPPSFAVELGSNSRSIDLKNYSQKSFVNEQTGGGCFINSL